ncbi:MAG: hypothetical protein ACJ75J_10730 [Cytophagaceae bacterium]
MKKILVYSAILSMTVGSLLLLYKKQDTKKPSSAPPVKITEVFSADLIKPPLKNLDIAFRSEKVISTEGKTIKSASGTKICIPAHAFVDGKGKPVQGTVDFKYREFHNRIDIFLSGIPMTYEGAQLESAGMIELGANFDGKPVFVNPQHKIRIDMASKNPGADFNLYYMDKFDQKWKLKKKNLTVKNEEQPVLPVKNVGSGKEQVKKKLIKLIKPKYSSGKAYNLRANASRFPEIAPYENIRWELAGGDLNEKMATRQAMILHRIGETDSFMIRIQGPISYTDRIFYPSFTPDGFEDASIIYDSHVNQLEEDENVRREKSRVIEIRNVNRQLCRSFLADGMGIWNCDRVYKIAKPKTIIPKFVNAQGEEVNAQGVYLADKDINSVFNFSHAPQITYNTQGKVTLWVVLDNAKIGVFRDWNKLGLEKNPILKLEISKGPVKTVAAVKAMLGAGV